MTNGEKIQTILDIDKDCTEVYGKNGMMTFSVPQDWWNAEYEEPVIRDNGVKTELNRVKDELGVTSELEKNSKKLEKDFGELDCISRADAIQAMQDKAKKLTNEDTINGLCGAVAILFDLPSVTPQLSSELEKNSKLEKIRDQLKSNLRGVEITLEVLVENDPLRPKMEGAKTTLEDCLELIDKAEAESI